MTLEIELKFPISQKEPILQFLDSQKASQGETVEQKDFYFSHPSRDFGKTDEALRIRCIGNQSFLTYKGPVLDTQTKTRKEIEIPVGSSSQEGDSMATILELLGFRRVRSVEKTRMVYHFTWNEFPVEICLDEVKGLGQFLEIETIAEEAQRDDAQQAILHLADHLGLKNREKRSYLCMLLDLEK